MLSTVLSHVRLGISFGFIYAFFAIHVRKYCIKSSNCDYMIVIIFF